MVRVAIVARPRLWLACALLAVTLFGRHDAERAPVLVPPPAVVATLTLDRAMVQTPPETGDHMNIGVAPLASWINHLLQKLSGDSC